jgi:hypothetical protein
MVIGFIFSLFRNNNHKTRNTERVYDYQSTIKSSNNLNTVNICPECGRNNSNNAKFCNDCGHNFVNDSVIYCPKCGEKNSKNSKFCQGCGVELDNI